MSAIAIPHRNYVQRLYRQALRTAFDHHAFEWAVYRQHCLRIRARFDANRHETNPVRIKALIKEAEEELVKEAHPRPFKCIFVGEVLFKIFVYTYCPPSSYVDPTAPGGVKYERNHVPSQWLVDHGEGNWQPDTFEFEKIK